MIQERHVGITAALCALIAVSACDVSPEGEAVEIEENNTEAAVEDQQAVLEQNPYSPFGVFVRGNDHFDIVSFKDVGVGHFTATRDPLLESIADSLALNMSIDPLMPYEAELMRDTRLSDPNNHRHCAMDHIYVDLWTSEQPDRWGYSLWSGCGEDDQFAWEEVNFAAASEDDFLPSVQALTNRIADRIREADRTDCFTKSC